MVDVGGKRLILNGKADVSEKVELSWVWKDVGFPSGSYVKNLPAMQESQETQVLSLGQ